MQKKQAAGKQQAIVIQEPEVDYGSVISLVSLPLESVVEMIASIITFCREDSSIAGYCLRYLVPWSTRLPQAHTTFFAPYSQRQHLLQKFHTRRSQAVLREHIYLHNHGMHDIFVGDNLFHLLKKPSQMCFAQPRQREKPLCGQIAIVDVVLHAGRHSHDVSPGGTAEMSGVGIPDDLGIDLKQDAHRLRAGIRCHRRFFKLLLWAITALVLTQKCKGDLYLCKGSPSVIK